MIAKTRREVLRGIASMVAAPAVMQATNIMPISVPNLTEEYLLQELTRGFEMTREAITANLYGAPAIWRDVLDVGMFKRIPVALEDFYVYG